MTQEDFCDLNRKAMIKYYMELRNDTVSILDAANEIYSFIESHYEYDADLAQRLENYDRIVDRIKV
jgi:hypothetical protein